MLNNKIQILRKNIPFVELVSTTSQQWFDWDGQLVDWSGSFYIGPNINDVYYNVTGNVNPGYYTWTGTKWNTIEKKDIYDNYNLPIFLENNSKELGIMVGFDGNIEQIEQLVNFTYKTIGNTLTVYNSINPNKLKKIVEQSFIISWGDGTTSQISTNTGMIGTNLPSVSHTYTTNKLYDVTITFTSPWTTQKILKKILIPSDTTKINSLGTFTGLTVPSYINLTGQTQDYLNNLDYTNNTGKTQFTYIALGKSKISEKKLYGSNTYSGVTYGNDNIGTFSAYTIDNLSYKDYSSGYTMITGSTSGFSNEEVFNKIITRDEHFLCFVDEPNVYSDIFVERGKESVMENNLRLGDIESIGELEIYQNEYFIIKKQ